jgi:hypothetical protein
MFASVLSLLLAAASVQTADQAATPANDTAVAVEAQAEVTAEPAAPAAPARPAAPAQAADQVEEDEDDPMVCRRRSSENGFGKVTSQKVCKPKSHWAAQRSRR